jgi:hypothetical protein
MKSKTGFATILVMAGMALFFAANASAADAWYVATIVRVGGNSTADTSPMYVMLTDTATTKAFTNKFFRIPDGRLNQVLAVLLTAASNEANVRILADPAIATDANRLLKAVYYLP